MCTFGVEFIHFAMIEKLQGVVLRTIKYNDKNAIVRVYTDMHGVMAFLLPQGNGKVARQRRALFQPLSLVEIVADIFIIMNIKRKVFATYCRVSELNSERLELYNLTEFVDFYIKFVIIVSVCNFFGTFFRFAFYVKLVVHWMTTITN